MLKSQAIELLGGTTAAAAEAVGITYQAVFKWPDLLTDQIVGHVITKLMRKGKTVPAAFLEALEARAT